MNKVLSEDEVNALLRGLSGGCLDDGSQDDGGCADYEPDDCPDSVEEEVGRDECVVLRGRLPILEVLSDRFARVASVRLTKEIGVGVELNPISIDCTLFGEFMRSLPVPTAINILSLHPIHKPILSIFDSRLVFSLVEYTMGNRMYSQPKIEGRDFTTSEHAIVDEVEAEVNFALGEAWREFVVDLEFRKERRVVSPQFAGVVGWKKPTYVYTFEVEIGSTLGAYMLVLPAETLEPLLPYLRETQTPRVMLGTPEDYVVGFLSRRKSEQTKSKQLSLLSGRDFFEALRYGDPRRISIALRNDHPQTSACVLSHLSPAVAAQVLLSFPAGVRAEVVGRMKSLEGLRPRFLAAVEKTILDEVAGEYQPSSHDRHLLLLDALGVISPESQTEVVEEILEENSMFFGDTPPEYVRRSKHYKP